MCLAPATTARRFAVRSCLAASRLRSSVSTSAPPTIMMGATAFVGFSLALWQMSIWYRLPWSTTIKATIDGLVYALLAGGVFGWLWPR